MAAKLIPYHVLLYFQPKFPSLLQVFMKCQHTPTILICTTISLNTRISKGCMLGTKCQFKEIYFQPKNNSDFILSLESWDPHCPLIYHFNLSTATIWGLLFATSYILVINSLSVWLFSYSNNRIPQLK